MQIEELQELASARRYAYAAFQRLMGDAPTAELFEALDCDVLAMAFEVIGAVPDAQKQLDALIGQLGDAPRNLDCVADEYARIFVGPAALPAPPWESVYRGGKRLLMTETTLSVREFYHACGYEAQRRHRVPDDHLAIELDFLSSLAQEASSACEQGDVDGARRAFDAGSSFLSAHLGQWVSDFATDLRERDGSAFYCALADALVAFVAADEALGKSAS